MPPSVIRPWWTARTASVSRQRCTLMPASVASSFRVPGRSWVARNRWVRTALMAAGGSKRPGMEAGFFPQIAGRGLLGRLAGFDAAAGQMRDTVGLEVEVVLDQRHRLLAAAGVEGDHAHAVAGLKVVVDAGQPGGLITLSW